MATPCLPTTVFAASLHLLNDIGLLVLDGKKVSSSLLRGVDSIELENSWHQLVFCVEKTIRLSSHEERLYISSPLVISSNTQLVSQVNFHLSCLSNERNATHFDNAPRVELPDGDSMLIPVKLDILSITFTAKIAGYEMEIERYNKTAKYVSLPQFAMTMADDNSLPSGVSELDRVSSQS